MNVTPYNTDKPKKEQVAEMFDNISHRYDFLNHFLSMGIDRLWRKKIVKMAAKEKPRKILDVATGTGDLAIALRKAAPECITGIDISEGMLKIGRNKIEKRGLSDLIHLKLGDSENLPFPDESFDIVTVAFGVRNFENVTEGLKEIRRVLRKDGKILVLEFSQPEKFPVKQLYSFYFRHILPLWGRLISSDTSAYTYLPESVQAFPYGAKFTAMMEEVGFSECSFRELSFGICSIYAGRK